MKREQQYWSSLVARGFVIALLAFGLVAAAASLARAQSPVLTLPSTRTSTNASSTIGVTNTFQSVFAANTLRTSCTIQNNASSNAMYVFFGAIASATTGASVKLAAGQSVNCSVNGIVLTDQVSVTGTSSDAFFAAQQ